MARSPFRVDPREVEAETAFVLEACLDKVDVSKTASASDLLAPQVPVTELADHLHALLEVYYCDDDREESKAGAPAGPPAGLPRDIESAHAAGVMWLHLRRRQIPLFSYQMFARMTELALDLVPLDDLEDAYTDSYADAVRKALALADLKQLVRELAIDNRHNLLRVLQLVLVALQTSPKLTSTEAIASIGPILAKPKDTTFMSIRHRRELGLARIIMGALVDHLEDLEDVWASDDPPVPAVSPRPDASDGPSQTAAASPASPAGSSKRKKAVPSVSTSLPPPTSDRSSGGVSKTLEAVAAGAAGSSPGARRPLSIVTVDEKVFPTPEQPKALQAARDEVAQPCVEQATKLINETVHRLCLGDTSWMRFVRVPAASVASPVPLAAKSVPRLGASESSSELKRRAATASGKLAQQQAHAAGNVGRFGARDSDESDRLEDLPASTPDPIVIRSASEARLDSVRQQRQAAASTASKAASQKLVEGRLERAFEKASAAASAASANESGTAAHGSGSSQTAVAGPTIANSASKNNNNNDDDNDNDNDSDYEKIESSAGQGSTQEHGRAGERESASEEKSGSILGDRNDDRDNEEERGTVSTHALRARLEAEKRVLKARLKRFDEEFARTHGRKPSRLEKEPIRHLYEEYNSLKRRITELTASDASPSEISGMRSRSGSESSMGAENTTGSQRDIRNQRLVGAARQRSIEALLGEKRALQTQLREFERKFEQDNKRKIRCAADIRGLEREYRRYKELKETLASLQVGQTPSPTRSPRYTPSPVARG